MPLSYEDIRHALEGQHLPAAFVDLDAFDRNVGVHLELIRGRGTPLRVASKSVRCVSLLRRALDRGGSDFRGILSFTCREAAFLAARGFDDFIVAYPPWQTDDLECIARLTAEGRRVATTSDSAESVERIAAVARRLGTEIRVLLCVDMSLRMMGGRVHLGVRRSPLHSPEEVLALAQLARATRGVQLEGLLGYEAQIAGLQDANPFDKWMNPLKAAVKRMSIGEVKERRSAIVELLKKHDIPLRIVNGGGTGSLDSTTPDTGITEVTAGSGFYKPHLFDYYRAPHMARLEPSAFFALEVTRIPKAGMATCLGGGYVASGPPGWDKIPVPWLPAGLELSADEACGEVQTPLKLPAGTALKPGDPVIFRHAKSGELMERFNEVLLVQGGHVVDRVPTYRGEGQAFL
jgi:D-serine deaminase-like pyridoxal phosphate-dependent protein